MTKQQAIQFLAQIAQDFLATLPQSARGPVQQLAQQAITVLEAPEPPPKDDKP